MKGISWSFTENWWCLWKFRILQCNKEKKAFIMFDDLIADMEANNKLNLIITELFLIVKKLNLISKWLKI